MEDYQIKNEVIQELQKMKTSISEIDDSLDKVQVLLKFREQALRKNLNGQKGFL